MGRHRNAVTGVVVSVDDAKDSRFGRHPWAPADEKKAPAKKAPAKSDKK